MKRFICVVSMAIGLTILSGNYLHAQAVKEEYKTKKPWSHKKKDALIGVGAGAVTGALVGHSVKGAAIGGAVGGGAGYLYGRHKDKKYGTPARRTYVYKKRVKG